MAGVPLTGAMRGLRVVHDRLRDAALDERQALRRLTLEIERARQTLWVEWVVDERDVAGDLLPELPGHERPPLLDRETGEL